MFFSPPIEIICNFAASKTKNSLNNNIKLIKNEKVSIIAWHGLPLHGGLQQRP